MHQRAADEGGQRDHEVERELEEHQGLERPFPHCVDPILQGAEVGDAAVGRVLTARRLVAETPDLGVQPGALRGLRVPDAAAKDAHRYDESHGRGRRDREQDGRRRGDGRPRPEEREQREEGQADDVRSQLPPGLRDLFRENGNRTG